MLVCNIMVYNLACYHFVSREYSKPNKNEKGSRIQDLPYGYSVLGYGIFQGERDGSVRFIEAIRSFHFENCVSQYLLQTSDLKVFPTRIKRPPSEMKGCPVLPKRTNSCEVACACSCYR